MKLWQIVVVFAVVVAMAGGGYGIYTWAAGPKTSSSALSNTQLVTVESGDLTNTVSSSGSVVFSSREKLTFGVSGTVAEVRVTEGDAVSKGQLLATLDSNAVINLEKAVVQARINLRTAEDNLEAALYPYSADEIAKAETALATAQKQLADNKTKSIWDIADAEYALYKAESAYWNIYDQFTRGIILYYQEVEKAKRDWDKAKFNLENIKLNAAKSVSDATDAVTKAEETLAEMKANIPDSLLVELKTLERDGAQAVLEEAQRKLAMASLTAPFDGVVTAVAIVPGQAVTATGVALEIVDPTRIEITAVLDEIDVPQVKAGQRVVVSLSSLPNLAIDGVVSTISSSGKSQSGVVTYTVNISITPPAGIQLREGMSAIADIVIQEVKNALLIPNQAISTLANSATVSVVVAGQVQTRTVQIGMSDGTRTEVISGLQRGEQVIIEISTTSTGSTTLSDRQRMQGGFSIPGVIQGQGNFIMPR